MHAQPDPKEVAWFAVGSVRCWPIVDGSFTYPTQWLFQNVDQARDELRRYGSQLDQVTTPYSCLLLETGTKRVLIDTGAGPLTPTTGHLLSRLGEHGFAAEDIDVVILTHAHPDHIGGAVDERGEAAFPNASYVMSAEEWRFWTSEHLDLSRIDLPAEIRDLLTSTAKRALTPLKTHLDLLEQPSEVVPGVHCVPAAGHTPGHLAVVIASGASQLLYAADAVLHPLNIEHPQWQTAFDLAPGQAADTRRKLLDRAAAEDLLFMAYHFPSGRPGQVRTKEHKWTWEPVDNRPT